MIVVNTFAGPGAGKSTLSAGLFHLLKLAGVNCELVTEAAKDWTWEGNMTALRWQPYVLGEQSYRIARLDGQVDLVVTDSPLLLAILYAKDTMPESFRALVTDLHHRWDTVNLFIRRSPSRGYNPAGRNQTEAEAEDLDARILALLAECRVPFIGIPSDGAGPAMAFHQVMKALGRREE